MILLQDWLKKRENAGEAMGLRIQRSTGCVPLIDRMFDELPHHLEVLVVEGVVEAMPTHSVPPEALSGAQIVSGKLTFSSLTMPGNPIQPGLLSDWVGQQVRVICRQRQLVVEPCSSTE